MDVNKLIAAATFFLTVIVSNAFAKPSESWKTACGDIAGVQKAKYCFHQTGPNPKYTIWFFHGVSDSEKVFLESNLNQDSYLEFTKGLPDVNVVTVSFGYSWMITDYANRTEKPANATVDVFASQIVPYIEAKFSPAKPYVAMGHSAGGMSAATVCAALPEMWKSCVMLNAMMPACDPFAKKNCNYWGVNLLVKENYSQSGWNETQPLVQLDRAEQLPKSLITACSSDKFSLFDGAQAWAQRSSHRGFATTWIPVTTKCDHAHWPAAAVLEFLK